MKKLFYFFTIIFFIMGCGSEDADDSSSSGNKRNSTEVTTYILGSPSIVKGPFKSNSNGFVQETDSSYDPSGNVYNFSTSGNFGLFRLNSALTTQNVEICATGYYFIENTGLQSQSQITLCSYSDIVANPNPVTNLLTTLQHKRIKYLIDFEGKTIAQATRDSQTEVLTIFGIDPISGTFDEMDIGIDNELGGVLLAVSVIMQEDHTAGELQTLIGDIALDIESDGILDDPVIKATLLANSQAIDMDAIKSNVESYYAANGVNITIDEYVNYIDSDGDGLLNGVDDNTPDSFSFVNVTDSDLDTEYTSNEVTISGLSDSGTTEITGIVFVNNVELSNPVVENNDIIKLKLTSDVHYSTTQSISITIGGVVYIYSVTTKADDRQQIIIFDSGQPSQDGDFGFSNAETWCDSQAVVNNLTGSISPLLATDSDLLDIVTQDNVNPRKVQSLNGGLISSQWDNFLEEGGNESFLDLGVVDDTYWGGRIVEQLPYNCNSWTSNGNSSDATDFGMYYLHDVADRSFQGDPRAIQNNTCDNLRKILCIAH